VLNAAGPASAIPVTVRLAWHGRLREKGICTVDLDPPEIETDLIDLTATSLRDLCEIDRRVLARSKAVLLEQLEHARGNIGTGPPGRID
jgi:hypothetical protein